MNLARVTPLARASFLALVHWACSSEPRAVRSAAAPAADRGEEQSSIGSASESQSPPEEAPRAVEPSDAPDGRLRLQALPVPDFLDAVLAVPAGSGRLPVLVSTHGAGGDPEWTCEEWGARVRGEALVVCPRGKAISAREPYGYYYPDHFALEKEVLATVAALEAAFPERVSGEPILYAGYSQGATMGALFLPAHAKRFPFLVLTEGGFASWTGASAKKFKAQGGQRVLFVCGGTGCRDRAKKSAALLSAAGVESRVELVPGGGHTDGGRVGQRLDEIYRWVLQPGE